MSILSVDNISPIGSGTSVTVNNAATLVVNNVNVSGVSTFSDIVDVAGSNSTIRLGNGANRRLMYRSGNNDVILEGASNFFYRQNISDTSHRWYTNGADEKLMITGAGSVIVKSGNLELGSTSGTDSIIHTTNAAGILYRADENGHRFQTYVSGWKDRLTISDSGVVQIDQGTAGGNHFKIVNDEISLLAGVNGTGDTYAREAFIGSTRVDSGSLPILRLAGQGGIKFCVDANSPRALLTTTGQFLFDTQTAFTSVAYRKIQIGQTDGGWINLARTGVPSDGNHLGAIQGFTKGANGSYHDTTAMDFKADGTQSNSSKGSKIEFWTTPENSTTKTLSVVINREGKFRTYDTVLGGDYSHHHQGWMQTRTFSVPIINNETRWYKIVNYAAGTMLVGKLDIYTSRGGGFNQTKGYSEWRISYNGYNNLIYGTAGDNTNFESGHAAGVEVVTGGSPKNVYIKVGGSIYGGRCYFKLEGTINNWQWDEGTYETSAP